MSLKISSVRDSAVCGMLMQFKKTSSSGLEMGSQNASGALRYFLVRSETARVNADRQMS